MITFIDPSGNVYHNIQLKDDPTLNLMIYAKLTTEPYQALIIFKDGSIIIDGRHCND